MFRRGAPLLAVGQPERTRTKLKRKIEVRLAVWIPRLVNGQSADLDLRQIRCPQSGLFGQEQVVIAEVEGSGRPCRARVFITHHCGADGVSGDRVQSNDEDAWRCELQFCRAA